MLTTTANDRSDSLILNRFAASFLVRSYAPGRGICTLDDTVGTAAVIMGISRETGSYAALFVFTDPWQWHIYRLLLTTTANDWVKSQDVV
ncbi:hypothetical protein BH24CHL10_BH24CHL10_01880 [soil metagenome]